MPSQISKSATIVVSIRTIKRPISGKVLGYRIVAARKNKAQYVMLTGTYKQSYHPMYRMHEMGDFSSYGEAGMNLKSFLEELGNVPYSVKNVEIDLD